MNHKCIEWNMVLHTLHTRNVMCVYQFTLMFVLYELLSKRKWVSKILSEAIQSQINMNISGRYGSSKPIFIFYFKKLSIHTLSFVNIKLGYIAEDSYV